MRRLTTGFGLAIALVVIGAGGGLAQKETPYELLGTFGTDPSTMIRDDALGRYYVTEAVSGWKNWDFMYESSGRLFFQVTYPPSDQSRYVELDFGQQVTPGAPYLGGRLSCLQVDETGQTYGEPFPGPAVPQFLKGTDRRVHTTFFRLTSGREWFEKTPGNWTFEQNRYLDVATMPDNGTPRYMQAWLLIDVSDLDDIYLGFNSRGLNVIGQDTGYLKVVRYGQAWTITPIPAGEAGFSGGSVAHLSVAVPTPNKRTYTSRNGNCDLGTYDMPFALTLQCDTSKGVCPLPAGPAQ